MNRFQQPSTKKTRSTGQKDVRPGKRTKQWLSAFKQLIHAAKYRP